MYLPSRLQKYWVIGRDLSLVIGFAASKGSSVRLTQTLRVPLSGFTKATNLPSGEICAPEISGSPKNSSRSIIGGRPDAGCARTRDAAEKPRQTRATASAKKAVRNFKFIYDLFRWFLEGLSRLSLKDLLR